MRLNYDEVELQRKADPAGRRSTSTIECDVARSQVIDALDDLQWAPSSDPRLQKLIEILTFAFDKGVL